MKLRLLTASRLAAISLGLYGSIAIAQEGWRNFEFKNAEMTCLFPAVPTESSALLNKQASKFFTSDSNGERFVVGYTPFPAKAFEPMRQTIANEPLGRGIRSLLHATVESFAQGGKAKVDQANFRMDKGYPAEFAILKNPTTALNLRVYLTPKRLYVFVAISTPDSALKFYNSIVLGRGTTKPS